MAGKSLGPGVEAQSRPTYPHMIQPDARVWRKFVDSGEVELREVWYDVHVGSYPAGYDDAMMVRIAEGVHSKRIDVVARVWRSYWVIEVKPRAGYVAFGQVLNYWRLFGRKFGWSRPVVPVIVCEEVDEDVREDFEIYGVGVWVVS